MALQLRRGTDDERLAVTFADGELVYTTDTKKLYVGDGATAGGNSITALTTTLDGDLTGSVFGDDSTLLVDGINNTVSFNGKDTDDLAEGSTNLYYTDARARAAISATGSLSYNSSTGVISTTGLASSDTDDLSEGSSNLYHTTARARAAISASGSLSYDNSTGVMSFTMNDETVQDIVGAMLTSNTETGITATYDDADGTIDLVVNATHFHSSVQTVTSSEESSNASATVDYTFSELTNAQHYAVFLNRVLLRPAEYSVSGTTVTVTAGVLAEDDELEVTGFTNT